MLVEGRREVAADVPGAAERIGAMNGVRIALDSMNKDKNYMMAEVGDKFFMFLKMECVHNPKAVLEGGGGEFCLEVMKTADPWSLVDCFGTLAQLVEDDGGEGSASGLGLLRPAEWWPRGDDTVPVWADPFLE